MKPGNRFGIYYNFGETIEKFMLKTLLRAPEP